MRYLGALILLFIVFSASAQNYKAGTWGITTIVLPGDSLHKWGGYAEFQVRTNTLFSGFNYYEYKGGISYDFNPNATALLGTGRYTTYDFDDLAQGPTVTETRFWEQFSSNQYIGRVKLEHRYRAEQRWLNTGYRNRFRYRLTVNVPINKPKLMSKTLFISVFEELFFNNRAPHFERNRFASSLGYQFDKRWTAQSGYLYQNNLNLGPGNGKNNLMLLLIYKIQRKNNNGQHQLASPID